MAWRSTKPPLPLLKAIPRLSSIEPRVIPAFAVSPHRQHETDALTHAAGVVLARAALCASRAQIDSRGAGACRQGPKCDLRSRGS
jgi:hypothetical protein